MIKMNKIIKEKGKVMGLHSTFPLSLPSPSDERLGRFHNSATQIRRDFCGRLTYTPLGVHPAMLARPYGCSAVWFCRSLHSDFHSGWTTSRSLSSAHGLCFHRIPASFLVCSLYDEHPDWSEVKFQCSFNFHFFHWLSVLHFVKIICSRS